MTLVNYLSDKMARGRSGREEETKGAVHLKLDKLKVPMEALLEKPWVWLLTYMELTGIKLIENKNSHVEQYMTKSTTNLD